MSYSAHKPFVAILAGNGLLLSTPLSQPTAPEQQALEALGEVLRTQPGAMCVVLPGYKVQVCRLPEQGDRLLALLCPEYAGGMSMQELLCENRELQAIFETSRDGIVVADKNGVFTRVNQNYSRISGIAVAEIVGKSTSQLVAEGTISRSATQLVLASGKAQSITQVFRTGRVSDVTANPLYDDAGQIFRIVTNVRDTTELNLLRDALASSQEKLDYYSRIVAKLSQANQHEGLIFRSGLMRQLWHNTLQFARVDAHVLIEGETGTGKELVAELLHTKSPRAAFPLLKVNCAAISDSLLESELFGYERGAFTGADAKGHVGLLEAADRGTIFLDEIGEMSQPLQAKLLRFLQTREFYRVGGSQIRKVDVRIVAATHHNLEDMVAGGLFRADFFHRLNILRLDVPPLRQRVGDIVPLCVHFMTKLSKRYGVEKALSTEVLQHLLRYNWPGNVRELENVLERLFVMSEPREVGTEHLPAHMQRAKTGGQTNGDAYAAARDSFEASFWRTVHIRHGSSRKAANAAGVDHTTVLKRFKKYGIGKEPLA